MNRELEKLDCKLESLISIYDSLDVAVHQLELIQFHSPLVNTSDVLSLLRERRLAVHVQIIETRKELVRSFRKHNVVEIVKGKKYE